MAFIDIRHAQQEIWPAVQQSLELHRAQREKINGSSTAAAKARARVPWNRVVANEAVWAIAKADRLLTDEQSAVIKAAKAWAKSWQGEAPSLNDGYEAEDVALYRAVQTLATVFDPPADEPLTNLPAAATVSSTNRN